MKIVYLDPGQANGRGHNYAMVHEFDEALVRERGHEVHHVVQRLGRPELLPALHGRVHPVIQIDGYTRLSDADVLDEQRRKVITQAVATDLARAPFADADVLLMPTVYPLHLRALADYIALPNHCRVVLGMLLPCSFWNPHDAPRQALSEWMAHSINVLASRCDLLVYSETGRFVFGQDVVPTATLLPPLAGTTTQLVSELATPTNVASKDRPVLGFFGSPFTTKGFELLARTLQRFAQTDQVPAVDIRVCLPLGHATMCEHINALGPWVRADSMDADNVTYLRRMAEVDVVWACYDPQEYCGKMSGIVPEAISLGKPVLLAEGCDALHNFLDAQAPGGFLLTPYDDDALVQALSISGEVWHRLMRCAAAHAPLMQQMKSMHRYLSVCGID